MNGIMVISPVAVVKSIVVQVEYVQYVCVTCWHVCEHAGVYTTVYAGLNTVAVVESAAYLSQSSIHLFLSVMFYSTCPLSYCLSPSLLSLSLTPIFSLSSHYSLSALSLKERESQCSHVTSLTHSSSHPGSNFTGTSNKHISHYRSHP